MRIEDFKNQEYYVVYEIFKDGSKSVYGAELDKYHILTKNQLRGVKAYFTRCGGNYEIYKVSVQMGERVQ